MIPLFAAFDIQFVGLPGLSCIEGASPGFGLGAGFSGGNWSGVLLIRLQAPVRAPADDPVGGAGQDKAQMVRRGREMLGFSDQA